MTGDILRAQSSAVLRCMTVRGCSFVQDDWQLPQELSDQERTNNGEVICEVATSATTTQSDRDIMLDQLVQLLSVSGVEDVFASLPQNCIELVNGAALANDAVDDSESNRVLMELSAGEPILNVTSVGALRTGGRRTRRRMLAEQPENGAPRLLHASEASAGVADAEGLTGARHCHRQQCSTAEKGSEGGNPQAQSSIDLDSSA